MQHNAQKWVREVTVTNTIRGVALDLEGTVIDVEAAHHQGHLALAQELGLELTLEQALVQVPHFIGGPDRSICEELLVMATQEVRGRWSVDRATARTLAWYEHFLGDVKIEPRPGFLEVLEEIRSMGLQISIGSLTPMRQADLLLERSGLRRLIGEDMIVLAEHVQRHKPAPDVFLETACRMGINPAAQLVFEDSPRGVQAALAAGSRAIGMPVYHQPGPIQALLDAGACRVFANWREINLWGLVTNLSQ